MGFEESWVDMMTGSDVLDFILLIQGLIVEVVQPESEGSTGQVAPD